MANEVWRRAMLGHFTRSYDLTERFLALRDELPDEEDRAALAWHVERLAGVAQALAWTLAPLAPAPELYAPPLRQCNDARGLARAGADLLPRRHLVHVLSALHISANVVYGTTLLLKQHPHGEPDTAARFALAGHFFAGPAAAAAGALGALRLVAHDLGPHGLLDAWRATCHFADLSARVALHLLCVGALGQPAFTELPSPLLPEPGQQQGPWPGWETWRDGWSVHFKGGASGG